MTSVSHSELTADQLHVAFRWVQEGDPGAGADHPGHYWLKLSTGELKRRKDDDSGWDAVGGTAGALNASDFTAKGDLLAGTGSGTYGHLGVGTDGYFLRAHSAAGDGLQYYDHEGAADPHPGYALDTDLAAYQAKSTLTTKGDLYVATASGVVTRVGAGADGKVLTADSGATPGVSWQTPGSGGVTNLRSSYASRAAAGTAGRIWLATDSVIQAFDDGAAWHEYYGSIPIFATNGFPSTWVNQGGSTIDTTKGGVIFHAPAGSGDNFRELVKSTPSTPYVITIGALFLHNVGTHEVGVGWRDSASGKMSVVAFFGTNLFLLHYTNPTTWSASVFSLTISFPFGAAIWFRLSDDGTNRKLSMSVDGINFQVMPGFTETRTTFLTADQIGFMVNVADGTYPVDAWYFSWDEA